MHILKKQATCLEKYGSKNTTGLSEVRKKRRETMKLRYGVESLAQLDSHKNKMHSEKAKSKTRETCRERYGVDNPMKNTEICEKVSKKVKQTFFERYGVTNPSQVPEFRQKAIQTTFEKFGVEYILQLPERAKALSDASQSNAARVKRKKTLQIRYGGDSAFSSADVRETAKQTMNKRYGVSHSMKCEALKKRAYATARSTCQIRYGGNSAFSDPQIYEKGRKTCEERHGSRHPMKLTKFKLKRNSTLKRKGFSKTSQAEKLFGKWLQDKFPDVQIQTQIVCGAYTVDFLLSDHLYIHFDGVYWHGLDRDIEVIKNSIIPRDKAIYRAYLKDRRQDQWFTDNNMKYLRITDREFSESPEKVLRLIQVSLESGY